MNKKLFGILCTFAIITHLNETIFIAPGAVDCQSHDQQLMLCEALRKNLEKINHLKIETSTSSRAYFDHSRLAYFGSKFYCLLPASCLCIMQPKNKAVQRFKPVKTGQTSQD